MTEPPPLHRARESGLVQRLRRSIAALNVGRPVRIVCGFSGGGDSLALLALLASVRRFGLVDVRAVHVDHAIRPGSAAEARQAVEVARSLGVECDVCTVAPDALEQHRGVGLEEALRRERYRAFADAVDQVDAFAVALGHHQGDQAETVLLHLLRGAGLRGASGMRVLTPLDIPWWEDEGEGRRRTVRIWRPFLMEPAGSIRSFADSLGLPIVDDESNSDLLLRRNAIRHQVLPILEAITPGAVTNLARFAELAGDDSDELDRQARLALEGLKNPEIVSTRWLSELPLAVRRRVLLQWCRVRAPGVEIGSNRIDEILRVARVNGPTRRVEIGSGWTVLVTRDGVCLVPPASS